MRSYVTFVCVDAIALGSFYPRSDEPSCLFILLLSVGKRTIYRISLGVANMVRVVASLTLSVVDIFLVTTLRSPPWDSIDDLLVLATMPVSCCSSECNDAPDVGCFCLLLFSFLPLLLFAASAPLPSQYDTS